MRCWQGEAELPAAGLALMYLEIFGFWTLLTSAIRARGAASGIRRSGGGFETKDSMLSRGKAHGIDDEDGVIYEAAFEVKRF